VSTTQSLSPELRDYLKLEYQQTNENFRALIDVRFKLLTLIPSLGGVAVYLLSVAGLTSGSTLPEGMDMRFWLVALLSMLGFAATQGVVFYDQRNSELYDALIRRAKNLEQLFGSPRSPDARGESSHGGQFNERPPRSKQYFGAQKMFYGHDNGLALIYGPVLGSWLFPASLAVLSLFGLQRLVALPVAAVVSLIAGLVSTAELLRLDKPNADTPKATSSKGAA
jgi:hypothetical protein